MEFNGWATGQTELQKSGRASSVDQSDRPPLLSLRLPKNDHLIMFFCLISDKNLSSGDGQQMRTPWRHGNAVAPETRLTSRDVISHLRALILCHVLPTLAPSPRGNAEIKRRTNITQK